MVKSKMISLYQSKWMMTIGMMMLSIPFIMTEERGLNFKSLYGYTIQEAYTYGEVQTSGVIECAVTCSSNASCKSVAFLGDRGRCIFSEYFVDAIDSQWGTAAADWYIYYTECPAGWVAVGTRCYNFFSEVRNYSDAEAFCIQQGGKLAEPTTSQQNELLKDRIQQSNPAYCWWFGLHDQVTEGQWVWLSNGYSPTYSDWGGGNPNDGASANCGGLWQNYDYTWVDESCSKKYGVICEI